MTVHELQGRAHAAVARAQLPRLRSAARSLRAALGQGTVEYVGLVLLMAVLIAGVVAASRSFKDTGIAEAVVDKIKGAIDGVTAAR
jgi:hypothetical protein